VFGFKKLMTEMTFAKLKMNGSNILNGFSWTMARLVTVLLLNHVNLIRNFWTAEESRTIDDTASA
jgi:hypothetical protein